MKYLRDLVFQKVIFNTHLRTIDETFNSQQHVTENTETIDKPNTANRTKSDKIQPTYHSTVPR